MVKLIKKVSVTNVLTFSVIQVSVLSKADFSLVMHTAQPTARSYVFSEDCLSEQCRKLSTEVEMSETRENTSSHNVSNAVSIIDLGI